jgi:hypothetical protein
MISDGQEGFDMRFCDKNGFFGPGNYFALSAGYSTKGFEHQEQSGDLLGKSGLFLAKVLIGDVLSMNNTLRGTK